MWEIYYIIFSFYYYFVTIMNIQTLLGGLALNLFHTFFLLYLY